jgi:hypothetical protein
LAIFWGIAILGGDGNEWKTTDYNAATERHMKVKDWEERI